MHNLDSIENSYLLNNKIDVHFDKHMDALLVEIIFYSILIFFPSKTEKIKSTKKEKYTKKRKGGLPAFRCYS